MIVIRQASVGDISAAAEIYEGVHTAEEAGITHTGWLRGVYPDALTAKQGAERGDLFLMEADGIPVGTAIFNFHQEEVYRSAPWRFPAPEDKVLVMHTLAIHPKFAKQGYGSAFLRYYESLALSLGCEALRIDTNAKNLAARAFYQKHGFTEVGTYPCPFHGIPDVCLVLLEKPLHLPEI